MMRPYGPPPIPLANAVPAHSTAPRLDRKSTRLNSSHSQISYAVFCLKKKKKTQHNIHKHCEIQCDYMAALQVLWLVLLLYDGTDTGNLSTLSVDSSVRGLLRGRGRML